MVSPSTLTSKQHCAALRYFSNMRRVCAMHPPLRTFPGSLCQTGYPGCRLEIGWKVFR